MKKISDFVLQVCLDCYRITNSKVWNDDVIEWFIRNDFIPACWHDDYLLVVKGL